MITNEIIFDEGNINACINLKNELSEILEMYDDWSNIYSNAERIMHVAHKWPMNTNFDDYYAKVTFAEMFNNAIKNYINSQGKEKEEST